jgi:hypothetical protein
MLVSMVLSPWSQSTVINKETTWFFMGRTIIWLAAFLKEKPGIKRQKCAWICREKLTNTSPACLAGQRSVRFVVDIGKEG